MDTTEPNKGVAALNLMTVLAGASPRYSSRSALAEKLPLSELVFPTRTSMFLNLEWSLLLVLV